MSAESWDLIVVKWRYLSPVRSPSLSSHDPPTMSDSSYAHQLSEAAKVYHSSCTAYASFRATHHGYIALHVQSPEIMMQFVGDVDFGKDPKGLLFYRSNLKWPTDLSTYTIFYYGNSDSESTSSPVVRVDFYESGKAGKLTPFARFLANAELEGKWAQLKAASCPMRLTRTSNHNMINLGSHSIYKQAYFTCHANVGISHLGFLFFTDLWKLKTKPNGRENCVANYTSDRIVFHIEGKPDDVVARVSPGLPCPYIDFFDPDEFPIL
ncbi:hypothetical protein BGY98DRAFT_992371 [Russula aff. rugulosa BPL654]|nr:hypothetical protein BGY98DRAFT_992371 [Russula aff. rugulosa BPL654]